MTYPFDQGADYTKCPPLNLIVPISAGGRRFDQVLAALLPQHSRNRLQAWIRDGLVCVDGKVISEVKTRLAGGERLLVHAVADPRTLPDAPQAMSLAVVFEDEHLLVINKSAGIVVHPGSGNWQGTLLNGLLHHAPTLAHLPRAGIVHRLDKDTSGLMVVAKTETAQTDLVRQLQARSVRRQYWALAQGQVPAAGEIDAPLGRHPVHRVKMAVVSLEQGGKPALTRYRVLERFHEATLVECSLATGRTHQIRVHLAHIGHALLGDPVYGRRHPRLPEFPRQALHALRLGLIHPASGQEMLWESALPPDFLSLLETLRAA